MENKYYTPTLEEFHVGFEFEWQSKIRNETWNTQICDVDFISIIYDAYEHADYNEPYEEQFRVKYLDKEDIESLGFKKNEWSDYTGDIYTLDRFILFYNEKTKVLTVTDESRNQKTKCGYFHHQLFDGEVKNKSELKRVLKMLNIK